MKRLNWSTNLTFASAVLYCITLADAQTPSAFDIQEQVEAQTVQDHTGLQLIAVDNSTASPPGNSTGLSPAAAEAATFSSMGGALTSAYNVTAAFISNITASSPEPAQNLTKGAAKAPSYGGDVDGGDLFITSDGSWSYSDSKYAAPVAIILLLLLLAGAGLFFVVRRRRMVAAKSYYGLKEAELGGTHRTV